mmetsp:Transcript_82122/g.213977  ORF Transcript_82122/g.213977 Transcript_82122/m.213977 type:complete len:266 (+) Transcript_82122:93-890(+)
MALFFLLSRLSMVMRQTLVWPGLAVADPTTDDVDHRAPGDGPGAAGEHPEGVCGEIMLPGHAPVDVLRRHCIVEALTPEGQECRNPAHRGDSQRCEVHAQHAAEQTRQQSREVGGVALQVEAIPHTAADHVAKAYEDEKDHEVFARGHHVVVHAAIQGRLLVVEGVEIRRQRPLHDEVADDVGKHERHHPRQPTLPIPNRVPHLHLSAARPRRRGAVGLISVVAVAAAVCSQLPELRGDLACEDAQAHRHASDDVPEQGLYRQAV